MGKRATSGSVKRRATIYRLVTGGLLDLLLGLAHIPQKKLEQYHPLRSPDNASVLVIMRRKIIAVMDTTFAVAKRMPEKIQACTGLEPQFPFCDTTVH